MYFHEKYSTRFELEHTSPEVLAFLSLDPNLRRHEQGAVNHDKNDASLQ